MNVNLKKAFKEFLVFLTVSAMVFSLNMIASHKKAAAASTLAHLQEEYPDGSTYNGNYKKKAWQSHGLACTLGDALTGRDPYTWARKP